MIQMEMDEVDVVEMVVGVLYGDLKTIVIVIMMIALEDFMMIGIKKFEKKQINVSINNFSGTSLLVFVRLKDTRCNNECFYNNC